MIYPLADIKNPETFKNSPAYKLIGDPYRARYEKLAAEGVPGAQSK